MARRFHQWLDDLLEAMPEVFDAHMAQRWYQEHHPDDFRDDLMGYGGNGHTLAVQLSKAIDRRPDVQQIGLAGPSRNLHGNLSQCTKWRKILSPVAGN